jgi:NSS family neurotransmitter:Na+ symporter
MMLAMLGMAVGTGNIWRFPRIAAQNGGGEFLIAWVVFLFLWSIPLILLEFGMGRKTRCGPVKAFVQLMGPRWAWMGAFCVFVTTAIVFYYSVVAGWTLRYTVASITGEIPEEAPGAFWNAFTSSPWPVLTHGVMIGLAAFVVARGVKAIERVALVLMPILILLVFVLAVRALLLPGASQGLSYLFSVDLPNLASARVWIEALTQNAWDTGAGWGLVLCYAAYLREREDTALNAFVLPVANNGISLLAAIMVFCTVFSVVPGLIESAASDPSVLEGLGKLEEEVAKGETFSPKLLEETIFSENNEGITFIWMPQLFKRMSFGRLFMVLFFLALAFAAFTSLVAMVEVSTRALIDAGMERVRAIRIVGVVGFALGIPSALWLKVLNNQDWVWGVALMLSGLFFAISIITHGIRRFRLEHLNHEDSDIKVGRWWDVVIGVLVPMQAVFLLVWFLYQSRKNNPHGWLEPFDPENVGNVGTVLVQFAVVLVALILLNKFFVRKTEGG